MSWQDEWERHARGEYDDCNTAPVSDLLKLVQAGYYGAYYMIWDSIAERSTLQEAGWTLFGALEQDVYYLYRYHAAEALLALMGDETRESVQLSADDDGKAERLAQLARELTERIGARPASIV